MEKHRLDDTGVFDAEKPLVPQRLTACKTPVAGETGAI